MNTPGNLDQLAAAVLKADAAVSEADRAYWCARQHGAPCARQHRREFGAAVAAHRAALSAVRRAIADDRGWTVAKTAFDASRLTGGRPEQSDGVLRHLDCFRERARPYKPAAIVTHSYRKPHVIEAWAAAHRLRCEILPASWYSQQTTAALLTRADQ